MRGAWRFAILCLLISISVAVGAAPNEEIAGLYVDAAMVALDDEAFERATELLNVAEEFGPEQSDVHYLRALLQAKDRDLVRDALASAARARENASWRRFTPLHGRVFHAELLNRVAMHEEARTLLESMERSELVNAPEELLARRFRALLESLWRTGREAAVGSLLDRARDRFPDDPIIFRYALLREPLPSTEYRREIERLLEPAAPGIEEVLYEYARRAPTPAERDWAIAQLEGLGWGDPALATVMASSDEAAAVEYFMAHDGLADLDSYHELRTLLSESALQELNRAAAEFSGTSYSDADRDGYWNERVAIEGGRIRSWERDPDQNGLIDTEVTFGDLAPTVFTRRDDETTVVARFDQYPFLDTAAIDVEAGTERFHLRPRSVRLGLVEALPEEGPLFSSQLQLNPSVRPVTRREFLSAAIVVDLVAHDGTVVERTRREAGTRTKIQRDEDRDGTWDQLLITRGGFAISGVRDLDGDGYYEIAEGYRNGRLVALAVDADDDGVPEMFERRGETPVREWDLNEDGLIDVREFSYWTDTVLREFPLVSQ